MVTINRRSRNKLTKQQLYNLRVNKYIVFERSYENCIARLNYMKAIVFTNIKLHKYSYCRLINLYDYVHKNYPIVLFEMGYTDRLINYLELINQPKLRRIKISLG